jgi:hypothetical protein
MRLLAQRLRQSGLLQQHRHRVGYETLPELPALLSGAANESDDASVLTEEPYQPFLERRAVNAARGGLNALAGCVVKLNTHGGGAHAQNSCHWKNWRTMRRCPSYRRCSPGPPTKAMTPAY